MLIHYRWSFELASRSILAIDPGREKVGMAVLESSGKVLDYRWVLTQDFDHRFKEILDRFAPTEVVLGDRTYYKLILARIQLMKPDLRVHLVDESFSTLEARSLYWSYRSPSTLGDHIFRILNLPTGPWDDITAIVLARRFLESQ